MSLLVALLLAQSANPSLKVVTDPVTHEGKLWGNRYVQVVPDAGAVTYGWLEFAPTTGAGMTVPCACTTVTGAKGETFSGTRASAATCTKTAAGGLSTSGIAVGDLVTCGANTPRVEYDSQGYLGVLLESSKTNSLVNSDDVADAGWTATATVTANAALDPFGNLKAAQVNDTDNGTAQGVAQAVALTTATVATVACYVRAGTTTVAKVSLVGTGSSTGDCTTTKTGLSTTTFDRVVCTSAAAYAGTVTAKSVVVTVGSDSTATGTVFVAGCDLFDGSAYVTSHVVTAGASGTRAADLTPDLPAVATASTGFCMAASINGPTSPASFVRLHGTPGNVAAGTGTGSSVYVDSYYQGGTWTAETSFTTPATAAVTATLTGQDRAITWASTTQLQGCVNATCSSTATVTAYSAPTFARVRLGQYASGNGMVDGIVSRVYFDPTSSTSCR